MFFSSIFAAGPGRSPTDDFWFRPLGFAGGKYMTGERALQSAAVYACIKVISETLGSLPLITYERIERGKERAPDHPMYRLLRYAPNPRQTAMEFIEMLTAHAALRGNGYALKVYRGQVLTALMPLCPDHMQVDELDNGRLGYLYRDQKTGQQYRYLEDDIFHLRGMSLDGKVGLSPISYQARAIAMGIAADEYGERFFENDATPGGILKHPGHFADGEKRESFKKAWQAAQSGANRGKTAVLEDGMAFEAIGLSNADAQFLESRRFQVEEIARIFRVPLVLIGETTKSTSWGSGVEQFMISFMTHTMRPWAVRWEQALQRDFFDDETVDDEYFAEFLVEGLLRGDAAARTALYKAGIVDGWMTRNEVRARENMNPLPGLDEPLEPLNMARSSDPRETPPAGKQDKRPSDEDDEDDTAAKRINRREIAAIRRSIERGADAHWPRRFYAAHESFVRQHAGVSAEVAREYCIARRDQVMTRGPALSALLATWEQSGHVDIEELMT